MLILLFKSIRLRNSTSHHSMNMNTYPAYNSTRSNTPPPATDAIFSVSTTSPPHSPTSPTVSPRSPHLSPTSRAYFRPISPNRSFSSAYMPKSPKPSPTSLDSHDTSVHWSDYNEEIQRPIIAKGRELGTFEQEAEGLGVAQDVHPHSTRFTERPAIAKRRRVDNNVDGMLPSGFFLRAQGQCFKPQKD